MSDSSVLEAMKLISVEGMLDSSFKKWRVKRSIEKAYKKHKWTLDDVRGMPIEWQWMICCARLQLGHLDWEGWNFRDPRGGMIPFFYPQWDGKWVDRLLVFGEQGVGDEVMFSQMLPEVARSVGSVTFECEPRLASIFRRSFPEIDVVGRKDIRDNPFPEGSFDAQIPIGSLCSFYRTKLEDFSGNRSYLVADPVLVTKWAEKLPGTQIFPDKYGITWKGRQGEIDPEKMRVRGDVAVNLQYGECTPKDWMFTPDIDLTNDLEDVFAILSLMKKVVGVPNSLIHFAASMGVPCDVIMTPWKGEVTNALNWRWGLGDKTPWHPSVTIYRSEEAYGQG